MDKVYQKNIIASKNIKEKVFWTEKLGSIDIPSHIPTDFNKGERVDFNSFPFSFSESNNKFLLKLSNNSLLRLNVVLISIVNILLQKYMPLKTQVIATPILKQDGPNQLVNTFLPVLVDISPSMTAKELILKVKDVLQEAAEHQNYPIDLLSESMRAKMDIENPWGIFNIGISLTNIHDISYLDGANCQLLFNFTQKDGEISGNIQYNANLYSNSKIKNLVGHLNIIIEKLSQNIECVLQNLQILSEQEKEILDNIDKQMGTKYPCLAVHEVFKQNAEKFPDRIAVTYQNESITYKQLDEKASILSQLLRKKGVTRNTLVGILENRSIDYIIDIIAILKAGGVYLPLDQDYPVERIHFMLKDSNANYLVGNPNLTKKITDKSNNIQIQPIHTTSLSSNFSGQADLECINEVTDPAYVIYTSGTTGQPKGVAVTHENIIRLLLNNKSQFDFGCNDVWSLFHSFCFDFSVWEMYGALFFGGRIAIASKDTARTTSNFHKLLNKQQVTILNQTPSAFYNLLNETRGKAIQSLSVKYVVFGGEALEPAKLAHCRNYFPNTKLVNMFGITETTVHVTYKEITQSDIQNNISNLGHPIPTTFALVLNSNRELVPPGIPGELCVGGKGLAMGYLNRVELTHEKFVNTTLHSSELLLYKSGDLAKMLENGELEYIGRMDRQVQLRGFRIELKEIETRLMEFPGVHNAYALSCQKEEESFLCAYVVSENEINNKSLREFLSNVLPDYMIPSYFIQIDELPLTINGKINKNALPEPAIVSTGHNYVKATTDAEKKLSQLWEEVLEVEKVGTKDSFFNLGGDSIKAIKLTNAINQSFSKELKISDLYANDTIENLAPKLEIAGSDGQKNQIHAFNESFKQLKNRVCKSKYYVADEIEDAYPMSDIQKGMVFHSEERTGEAVYHDQMVHQVNISHFEPILLNKALETMVQKHPILRSAFNMDAFEEPCIIVFKKGKVDYQHQDLANLSENDKKEFLLAYLENDCKKKLKTQNPGIWRFRTFDLGKNSIFILFVCHHAIVDGWSDAAFMTELNNIYIKLVDEPGYKPKSLKSSYRDFIIHQLLEKENKGNLTFWKEQLKDYKYFDNFALKQKNTVKPNYSSKAFPLSKELTSQIQDIAKKLGISFKNICFAACTYSLYMFSYKNEFILGMVSNSRPVVPDGDKILGCFLNTVPVQVKIPAGLTILEYIQNINQLLGNIYQRDKLPLTEILNACGIKLAKKRNLFDVLFNYVDFHVYKDINPAFLPNIGEQSILAGQIRGNVRPDTSLNLVFSKSMDDVSLLIEFEESTYDTQQIDRLGAYCLKILESFVEKPGDIINKPMYFDATDNQHLKTQILKIDEDKQYANDNVLDAISRTMAQFPDKVAIKHNSGHVTYKALWEKSQSVAQTLLNRENQLGIVAVILEPSIEYIIALLGILRADGVYLSIERNNPVERIKYMLGDSRANYVITRKTIQDKLNEIQTNFIDIDQVLASETNNNQIIPTPTNEYAYVNYTSGTTGRPNGVLITRSSMLNFCIWSNMEYKVSHQDVTTKYANLGFDPSVWEIFPFLIAGSTINIVPEELKLDIPALPHWYNKHGITISFLPTPIAEEFQKYPCKTLKILLTAGDKLYTYVPNTYEFYNNYGPTEATIITISCLIKEKSKNYPIGKPTLNTGVFIADEVGNIQPFGVHGELCLAGVKLAKGYLNKPELTIEKFSENNLLPNITLYHTGDIAAWENPSSVLFLGRIDFQVQIQGIRIETQEIESILAKIEHVEKVVVTLKEIRGENKLVGYYSSPKEISQEKLFEALKKNLPPLMIPFAIVYMKEFPLTAYGKVDHRKLPIPDFQNKEFSLPANDMESTLREIWADVLNLPPHEISTMSDFFEMGGHSLKLNFLTAKIEKEFDVKIPISKLFEKSTISDQAKFIQQAETAKFSQIRKTEKKEYYPLSSAQKRLFIVSNFNEESIGYNAKYIAEIKGKIDIHAFEKAFVALIHRHESLRTAFRFVNNLPSQVILDNFDFKIHLFDENKDAKSATDYLNKPFDLNSPPLMRVGIVKKSIDRHLLVIIIHHIVSDGVTANIFYDHLMKLYTQQILKPLKLQYKDYAVWQNQARGQKYLKAQEKFWLDKYGQGYPILNLPADFPRPQTQSFEGDTIDFSFDKTFVDGLEKMANEQGLTVYMIILAAYNILLSKLSNNEDIIIGTQVSGRTNAETNQMIGVFINALALRNFPKSSLTILEFLQEIKQNTLECFNNQDYKFEDLVEKVVKRRDASRNPMFDCAFNFLNLDQPDFSIQGMSIQPIEIPNNTTRFDLNLMGGMFNGGLFFSLQYSSKIFKRETINRFVGYFQSILGQINQDTGIILRDIKIIPKTEAKIISQHIQPLAKKPKLPICDDIFKNAEQYPHKVAIKSRHEFITYQEMKKGADRVASHLHQLNIEPESIVGVLVDRSLPSLIAILAVHRAGYVYLPVDPKYPKERIKYILKDCRITHILYNGDNSAYLDLIPGEINIVRYEKILRGKPIRFTPTYQENAYILYTSGSTGHPKGCLIPNWRVAVNMNIVKNRLKIKSKDVYLHTATFSFSSAIRQMFMPMLTGCTVRVASHEEFKDPYLLLNLIKDECISIIDIVPSYWNNLTKILQHLEPDERKCLIKNNLQKIVSASEPLLTRVISEWRNIFPRDIDLYNMYGQTETAGLVCIGLIDKKLKSSDSLVPFGKPLEKVSVFFLDKNKDSVPLNVLGEIHIGNQIPTGYLNKPDLTLEKVCKITDINNNQHYVYATGDYARLKPTGEIDFQGRIDSQIKIRGMRVEIPEIENVLLSIKKVKSAAVIHYLIKDQNKILVAYIILKEGAKAEAKYLKEYLSDRLPDYMVPQHYEFVETFPMTTSGKVNRKALPVPSVITGSAFELPQNQIEKQLLEIWSETLNLPTNKISVESDFFEMGGNSLLATILLAKIHKELKVKLPLRNFFAEPSIKRLAKKIMGAEKSKSIQIKTAEKKEYYPLSAAQRRLFAFQQINPENVGYNMPQMYDCKGNFDKKRITDTVKLLIQRHENLRTAIITRQNGKPFQYIYKQVDFDLFQIENPSLESLVKPFNLSQPPLLRVGYSLKSEDEFVLFIDMHHIISDAISHQILASEFVLGYEGLELKPVQFQYKDFANWQNDHGKKSILEKQKQYWLEKIPVQPERNLIPADFNRPETLSNKGGLIPFEINETLSAQIDKNALETGTTTFMYLLSVFYVWLNKLTNQKSLVVGTPVAGRRYSGMETIMGMFINTLALKIDLSPEQNFADFLQVVKENVLDGFENQDYQFDDLVDELEKTRVLNQHPIFNYLFVLQNAQTKNDNFPKPDGYSLDIQPYPVETIYSKFDLSLIIYKTEGKYVFAFEYSKDLFEMATITKYWGYFVSLLSQINQDPWMEIKAMSILQDNELQNITNKLDNEGIGFPENENIISLFKVQVSRTPLATALKFGNQNLTYNDLDKKSDALAGFLQQKGAGKNTVVGLLLPRNPMMVISIFGVLKAGSGYLPIDPDLPLLRIKQIAKDSNLKLLITEDELDLGKDISTIKPRLAISDNLEYKPTTIGPDNLAYIIYTSGSTGNPKGVMINHQNVVRLLFNDKFQFDFNGDDVWTLFHAYNFDFSVWEIFGSLLYGGKLVIVPKAVGQDTESFCQLLVQEKVTILNQTPPSFYNLSKVVLSDQMDASNIRYVIFGGEALSPLKLREWKNKFPQTRLINMYGITETTVHVTYKEITANDIENPASNIGKPIPTLSAYILDDCLNTLPAGAEGEIYVGGLGLSPGYINNPELTHEKFIRAGSGKRIYKSGDYGRLLKTGEIEYTGRKDFQVKIRGHRIEKGEIIHCLLKHQEIQDVVVVDKKDGEGNTYLVAYYVSGNILESNGLKEFASKHIPFYMIPAFFTNIPEIPLTANGKVDIKALPDPIAQERTSGNEPKNQMESTLSKIFKKVLNISGKVYTNDNFFDIGGNSLNATKLTLEIFKILEVKVPVIEIFRCPTISEIAEFIKKQEKTHYCRIPKAQEKELYNLTAAQKGLYMIQKLKRDTSYNIPFSVEIIGDLDVGKLENSIDTIIERHEIFRTKFIENGQGIFQSILPKVAFKIEMDNTLMGIDKLEQELIIKTINRFVQPFDLENELPYRIKLFRINELHYFLVFDIHHVIVDEVSLKILTAELFKLFSGEPLDRLSGLRYKDYAEYQFAIMQDPDKYMQLKNFWSKKIDGIQHLKIPYDSNNLDMSSKGGVLGIDLDFELTVKVNEFCRQHELTHNMFLFSAYILLLHKLTEQNDIAVGTVHEGRNHEGLENIIGFFVNTLIIRNIIDENKSLTEFLEMVKQNLLEAFENQDYNLDEIIKENVITRSKNLNSLIDTIFVFKNNTQSNDLGETITLDNVQFKNFDFKLPAPHFNLMLHITLNHSSINLIFEYSLGYFQKRTIELIAENYIHIIKNLIQDTPLSIKNIVLGAKSRRINVTSDMDDSEEWDL